MFIWIAGGVGGLIILSSLIGFLISAPKYQGPKSDHFNGKKFFNPNQVEAKGFAAVFKWYRQRDQGEWKELTEVSQGPPPPDRIDQSKARITLVNHSTVLVQLYGLNIITDPIWSQRTSPFEWAGPKRMRPPGIKFEDLPPIDLVIISHNHYDHLDLPTMKKIYQRFKPTVYVPLGVGKFLNNKGIDQTVEMDWWDEKDLSDQVKLLSVPAQHFSGRGTLDRDATLWSGYVIKTPKGNVFFAGDTGYGSFFKDIGQRCDPIKISLIPIGAYQPRWFMSPIHVSPQEAVQIHQDVQSEVSFAIHYGTFPLADDGMLDPVIDLARARNEKDIDEHDFQVLKEGFGQEVLWDESSKD